MKKIICSLAFISLVIACNKTKLDPPSSLESPVADKELNNNLTVSTSTVNVNSAIQVFLNGDITWAGGGNSVVERGFCYNTATVPTILNDTVQTGSGAGHFSKLIVGLTQGTNYYVRAYAIRNNNDIHYGNEVSFTTLTLGLPTAGIGTVTDLDGNVYNTITLGTQVWMVENLKTTHYNDGSPVLNITDNALWQAGTTPGYCDYDNNPVNAVDYGRIYNLYAIKDSRKLAPAGWHIPNFGEWITVLNYLGGAGVAGGRMKEAGFTHWLSPNIAADNTSGFTAVGGGHRAFGSGGFFGLKGLASFWSSSSSYNPNSTLLDVFFLNYNSASYSMSFGSFGGPPGFGFSVRCVKD